LVETYQKSPTEGQEVDLEKKRELIVTRLNDFYSRAASLFPSLKLDRLISKRPDLHNICACEETCGCMAQEEPRSWEDNQKAEYAVVPLPSSFDKLPVGWEVLAKREEVLRVAQANEALEALRSDIANKSYLYRSNQNLAQGKRERTRGYDAINSVEKSMRINGQRYKLATWALSRLGASDNYPQFQPLTRMDTKAVTAIYNPNKPGLRTDDLSWIWKFSTLKDSEPGDRLLEGKSWPS
jgi:hypothetical protein